MRSESLSVFVRAAALMIVFLLTLPACGDEWPDRLAWHEPVLVASGEAHEGRWRMNESDFRYVDDPTVALYPDGDVGVAWVDQAAQKRALSALQPGRTGITRAVRRLEEPGCRAW